MGQYDINLRDYLRILRRRKGIIVLVPLLFGLSSFAFSLLQAPRPLYRTTAVVRFERAVNITGLLQELVTYSPVGDIETQAALIKSFPVLSLAAKKLGLVPATATREEIQASPAALQSVSRLQDQVTVKQGEGTSLLEVSTTSHDPQEAVRVANAVAEAFQEDNFAARSRQVREAKEFIERQLAEVGTRLQDAEYELKTFKQTNRILLFPDETRESIRRLSTLETDLAATQAAIGDTEVQLRAITAGETPARPPGLSLDGTDPLSKLYGTLTELSLQRETLLAVLLPGHPQVKQVDGQLAAVRARIRDALGARLAGQRGRATELQAAIAGLKQEQAGIPEAEIRLARMERDVKVSERLFSVLKEKHQEILIREKEQVSEISLVRPAMLSLAPINPPQALPKALAGFVVGLVLGLVLAFVVEALDTSIGAIEDVESFLEIPVVGVIPHLDIRGELAEDQATPLLDKETEEKYAFLISLFLPNSRAVEAIRALRTNLIFSALEQDLKTIMVTSATPMEGKTTVAINLAIVLAQLGKRTLLVEADLRNPFLHHAFGIPKEPGLTDVVIGSARVEEATLTFSDFVLGKAGLESLIDRPGIDNLYLLPSGHQPPNPTEFLSAQATTAFLTQARERYDYIVLDCAPILPVADPVILGSRVDGALMVVRVGSVARAALRRARTLLEGARSRILGVCLTGVKAEVSPDYAEMGYYRYRYGVRAEAPRGVGRLGPALGGRARAAIGVVLLLAVLTAGVWAWRAGILRLPSLKLPPLPGLSFDSRRVIHTALNLVGARGARVAVCAALATEAGQGLRAPGIDPAAVARSLCTVPLPAPALPEGDRTGGLPDSTVGP
jgi:succinoglycan biosynthesis transport protein ExoP